MILFFNVLITDARASVGGMNRVDRLDLFKYALASYACIDRITSVVIYCELAGSYKGREKELWDYVHTLFPNKSIESHNYSPSNQREWRAALEGSILLITKTPILYMGNDDHIFIDYDLEVLHEGLDLMAKEPADQINTIHFSSWTEAVSTIYNLHDSKRVGRYWVTDLLYPDACQIVNSLFFRHIFFDLEMGDAHMRRTDAVLTNFYPTLGDYAFPSHVPHPKVKTFLPLRELVRHFDAYWHIGVPFEACPKLDIPPGFFDNNIGIGYCRRAEDRPDLYPWGPFLATGDRKILEDLPLFWRDRISYIGNYGKGIDPQMLLDARNEAHRLMMTTPHNRGYQNPFVRTPAVPQNNFRACPDNLPLPLAEEDIKVGYRV